MTPPAPADVARLIERAEKAVDDLCSGKLRWEMRVPAEPDHDPDLIISAALRASKDRLSALEEALDSLVSLGEDVIRDYEQGLCVLCHEWPHYPGCPIVKTQEALAEARSLALTSEQEEAES